MSNLIEYIITSIQNNIAFALIALGVIIIIFVLSLAIIFNKIGHRSSIAFIPIYNVMSLLTILNIPQWMVLLLFIPFVNIFGFIFMSCIVGYKLGTLCRKSFITKLGLMLLPIVFYPLLAFSEIDIDGSKDKVVVKKEEKKQFSLDPVEFVPTVEVPMALNLAESSNVDKISTRKLKPVVVVETVTEEGPKMTVAEHLAKANKERPTAQDLTFDYNLLYNSPKEREEKNEEVNQIVEEIIQPNIEPSAPKSMLEENDEFVGVDVVPIVHDVALEAAVPIGEGGIGLSPINKWYENKMVVNKNKPEVHEEKETLKEASVEDEFKPIILNNGPVTLDDSLSGLIASAPDFSAPAKVTKVDVPTEEKEIVIEIKKENIPTTSIQEIVSMDIVEPSQLPVGVNAVNEDNKTSETVSGVKEEPKRFDNNVLNSGVNQLLRPVATPNNGYALVDKACPHCNAKMKRDCPVCIICGYRF